MLVAGVDEVGRGPLAGPVVTAAVILNSEIVGIDDSKKLTPIQRKKLSLEIRAKALCFAFGRAEVREIDQLNIHYATLLAMKRAIEALPIYPGVVLIDGLFVPKEVRSSCHPVVKGDLLIQEIAAASILAKVLRDEEMEVMENIYPGYGFSQHKGYPTKQHRSALQRLGPCPIHRQSYALISASQ